MKVLRIEDHINEPLWVVSGPNCFPHLTLVKVLDKHQTSLTIWGWSKHRGSAGFRTLGQDLKYYLSRNENAIFYTTRAEALLRLSDLIPEVI